MQDDLTDQTVPIRGNRDKGYDRERVLCLSDMQTRSCNRH